MILEICGRRWHIFDYWQHGTECRKPSNHPGCFQMARSAVSCSKNNVNIHFSSLWVSCCSSWTLYFSNPILSIFDTFFFCIAVEFRWEALWKSLPFTKISRSKVYGTAAIPSDGAVGTLSQELHLCGYGLEVRQTSPCHPLAGWGLWGT